jgi:chemotaxis protein MotB
MSHGGGDGGGDRWLVSYADFITLLMVMFVVLYSMGQTDVKKYKRLAESMRMAFSLGTGSKIIDVKINSAAGDGGTDGQPDPITVQGLPKKPPEDQEVAAELTSMLQTYKLGDSVSVQTNIEGVLISLSEKIIFTPGTAHLQDEAYPVLDTIIKMLLPIENQVRIVGHTDTTPSSDSRYPTNWDLSVGRAIIISQYMISKGIEPSRFSVAGRGEYQPIFPNDTPEHRALNSRADIIVLYKAASNVIDTSSSPSTAPGQ